MFWTSGKPRPLPVERLFSMTQSSLDDEATTTALFVQVELRKSVSTAAESVGVMLAPRGASNVTPLTTVVALNSELADKIGQSLLSSSSQSYSEATMWILPNLEEPLENTCNLPRVLKPSCTFWVAPTQTCQSSVPRKGTCGCVANPGRQPQ